MVRRFESLYSRFTRREKTESGRTSTADGERGTSHASLVEQARTDDKKGCETEADGVNRHDAGEGGIDGEDHIDPEETRAADTAEDA